GLGTALLWREERRTRQEYERAEREHLVAERNFETARTTILEMGRRVEAIETGLADKRGSDLKRKAALDAARKEFERFAAGNPDDLGLKSQLAALHRYAGNVSRLLGDYPEAEAAYEASLALWDELAKRQPGEASHRDNLAQTLADAATAQKRGGRLRAAATTLDRAAALAEEIKDRVPLASYQRTLATALVNRAEVEYRLGNFEAAERAAGRAVELYDALKGAPPGQVNPVDRLLAVIAVHARGTALREMGKLNDALQVLDDGVARAEALRGAKGSRDVRQYANKTRLARATTQARTGKVTADAVRELGQVIEGAERLVADFPQTPAYKEVLTNALILRAEFTTRSAPAQAAADFDRALGVTRELIDQFGQQADHIDLRGRAFLGKGRMLVSEGKKPEAGSAFDAAVSVFRTALEKDPDNVHVRRGMEQAELEARVNPKLAKP
ncbi:MAG TPA: tetratricopeptide repeat protein, partial [Gemmataceae bacterium]|nr:tetratricopeptide repeat protein [Gemmataceae bacterium]